MTTLLLRNLDLLDLRRGELLARREILVRDGLIVDVSADPVSAGADTVVDLGGRTVMPGLIDCHVHVDTAAMIAQPPLPASLAAALAADELKQMLLRGFTTARDVAGADGGLRTAVERGLFPGPRLFVACDALTQTGGHGDSRGPGDLRPQQRPGSVVADGADAVRLAVRDNIRRGADHIKMMVSGGIASPTDALESLQYSEEELRAATEEAARAGRYVAAHAYTDEAVHRAVECGVRTIEHGSLIGDRAARTMKAADAILVPTFSPYYWVTREGASLGLPDYHIEKAKLPYEGSARALELARHYGVRVALGSDLFKTPHERQCRELMLRAEVEPPLEVLRSATLVGAEVLGLAGKIGEVVPGAAADLLAIDGNPLEDLGLLQNESGKIALILKAGAVVKDATGTAGDEA